MGTCCHTAITGLKRDCQVTIALAGNPNVGKSSIFNRLTGMGVVTANYPGVTVEVSMATTSFDGMRLGILDLPGIYALGALSDDQWVARRAVLEGRPDLVICIVDSTNLARNLYLVLQFLDLDIPLVMALNLVDQAEAAGLSTDADYLKKVLGVPVVPTIAVRGKGLKELIAAAVQLSAGGVPRLATRPSFGRDIEVAILELEAAIAAFHYPTPYLLSQRALAILLLEGDREMEEVLASSPAGAGILSFKEKLASEIEERHGEPCPLRMARERHGLAGSIAQAAQAVKREARPRLSDRLERYTTRPATGLPLLLAVLSGIYLALFYGGGALGTGLDRVWAGYVSPAIQGSLFTLLGYSAVARTLLWGVDAGVAAALSVGIPYVLTFYLILATLEDTGYLNSVAFLTDQLMHKLGLHGRAAIPLVAGGGCNVPAIMGTRVLTTGRERLIASTLICMVPCSARTAVIVGAVSLYAGWQRGLAIYIIVTALIVITGIGLNRLLPGRTSGLVMEMFPFRLPRLSGLLKNTWFRFRAFVTVAFPIVLGGSLVLGALYETGYLWKLAYPLSPIVEGWLGLPAVAGLTLLFAVLRKELALQLLVALAIVVYGAGATNLLNFMTRDQLFVYALVNTIYIPCVATIAVLGKELGWRKAIGISALTITIAVLVGGIARQVLLTLSG